MLAALLLVEAAAFGTFGAFTDLGLAEGGDFSASFLRLGFFVTAVFSSAVPAASSFFGFFSGLVSS